jgi:hypothetical protein
MDADPVASAKSLAADDKLPPVYKRGFMDPAMLKVFVLIHDCKNNPLE